MLRVASEAILPTSVEVSGSPVDITFDRVSTNTRLTLAYVRVNPYQQTS